MIVIPQGRLETGRPISLWRRMKSLMKTTGRRLTPHFTSALKPEQEHRGNKCETDSMCEKASAVK